MGFVEQLDAEIRTILQSTGRYRSFDPGDLLFREEDEPWVGVVQRGLVRISSLDPYGRWVTYRIVRAGGVIGIAALVGRSDAVFARSVGASAALQLDFGTVQRLRLTDIRFSNAVAEEIYSCLLEARRDIQLRLRGSLRRRLALELIDMAAEVGRGHPVVVPVTHEDLADLLGSSREVVSRALAEMASRGLVRQAGRGALQILDGPDLLAFGRGQGGKAPLR